jgi:hypothetical protein
MPSNDATTILMSTLPSILANSTDGIEVVDEFLEQPERWQSEFRLKIAQIAYAKQR